MWELDLPVESAGPQQRRVEDVHTVGGGDHLPGETGDDGQWSYAGDTGRRLVVTWCKKHRTCDGQGQG